MGTVVGVLGVLGLLGVLGVLGEGCFKDVGCEGFRGLGRGGVQIEGHSFPP